MQVGEAALAIVVNGLQVSRHEKKRYSAYHGIYVAASKNVIINAPQIGDTFSFGIMLSDVSGQSG